MIPPALTRRDGDEETENEEEVSGDAGRREEGVKGGRSDGDLRPTPNTGSVRIISGGLRQEALTCSR